jgi:nitrite reductase (NO-forming)
MTMEDTMTKSSNPGIIKTSRRNMLRGSVLAGAAALAGASAGAKPAPRAPKMNAINTASAKLHQAASKQDAASNAIPADPCETGTGRTAFCPCA